MMAGGQHYLLAILNFKHFISHIKYTCPTTVCFMVVFCTPHIIMPTTSTHCRHINQLSHAPVLLSTAFLSKKSCIGIKKVQKMQEHTCTKSLKNSQKATQLIFMDSEREEEDIDLAEDFWAV